MCSCILHAHKVMKKEKKGTYCAPCKNNTNWCSMTHFLEHLFFLHYLPSKKFTCAHIGHGYLHMLKNSEPLTLGTSVGNRFELPRDMCKYHELRASRFDDLLS